MPTRKPPSPASRFLVSPWRRAVVWILGVKVLLLVVAFDPLGLQAFDLPKALLSHAFALLLAALIVVLLAEHGTGIIPPTRLHIAVGALVLAYILSTVFAEVPYVAVYGERSRYLGLLHLLDMTVLYLAVAIAFRSTRDWAVLFAAIAIGAVFTTGYAALQRAGLDPVLWADDPRGRPFGTFGNPDQFGSFLAGTFGLGAAVAVFSTNRWARIAGAVLAVLCVVAIGIAATRAALVGVIAALVVLALVYLRVRGFGAKTLFRVTAATLAACVLLTIVLIATPLGGRVVATVQGGQLPDRVLLYQSAANVTAARPFLGWGPDSFAVAYPRYRDPASVRIAGTPLQESSAHSWLLDAAATTGVFGTAALLAIIALAAAVLWRSGLAREPVVAGAALVAVTAYLAQGIVTITSVGAAWILWAGVGAAVAVTAPPEPQLRRNVRRLPLLRVTAVAAGILGGLAGWGALDASRLAFRATGEIGEGAAVPAIQAARSAVERDPGRSQYWNLLGLAYDLQGRWRESGDAYAAAANRGPYEAVFWMNVARSRAKQALAADTRSGGPQAALDAARRAVTVDRNHWDAQAVLGEVANAFGQYEESLRAMARAIELGRVQRTDDTVVVDASAKIQDAALARSLIEEMVSTKDTATLRVALAKLDLRLNDNAAARSDLMRALELEPENAEARRMLESLGR